MGSNKPKFDNSDLQREVAQAKRRAREVERMRAGRGSTILTSGSGLGTPATVGTPLLTSAAPR